MPVDSRLTYEDYCLLPEDGKRYEIIEGELYVTLSPLRPHQKVLANLAYYLLAYVKTHRAGEVFFAPFDVVFSEFDVVEPDLMYISRERSAVLTEKNVQGAPDLVVEILSKSTEGRDRTTKLKLYARYGVREYWMIDPLVLTAEVYRLGRAGFEAAAEIGPDDELSSPLLPGFGVALRRLAE
ncbi:MAG TPA: Uma2 family endonuclease [Terriglobia bacterium]|nr:Uma2 family endonuclease [Terriglobia bacterium]